MLSQTFQKLKMESIYLYFDIFIYSFIIFETLNQLKFYVSFLFKRQK